MFVKKSRKPLNDSKGGLYIGITNHFSFLKFNLNEIACILKGKLEDLVDKTVLRISKQELHHF